METRRRIGRVGYVLALVLACVLGLRPPAAAQGSASGVVAGTIRDAQGGVLPGVTVNLRNAESGVLRSAEEVHAMSLANLDGEYCTVVKAADLLDAVAKA